jgi:pyruvate,orthophosphate dikinase
MLGTRGVRLGVLRPGLYAMQVRALMEAVIELRREGADPVVEIMIPLTVSREELELARSWVEGAIDEVAGSSEDAMGVTIGTMIETPRAALRAGELAEVADFFSFGTNDLTQMTFGYCRDAAERGFLLQYVDDKVLPANPFQTLDDAVASLMATAIDKGRATNPALELGICGEHGGDPASIEKCEHLGLDYVSCSPFRVPSARLAAARASVAART